MKNIVIVFLSLISIQTHAANMTILPRVLSSPEVQQLFAKDFKFLEDYDNVTIKSAGVAETRPIIQKFIVTLRGRKECSFKVSIQGPKVTASDLTCLSEDEFDKKLDAELEKGCM